MPVRFHRCVHTPQACPGREFLQHFPPHEVADLNQEPQRYKVHGQAPGLEEPAGLRGRQHRVHDQRSPRDAQHEEEEHEEEIHHLAQQGVVAAHFPQKPAGLQQGVGDLANENNCIDFRGRLAEPQHHDHATDAQRVVEQHEVPLCLEIQAPAQVKDEVTQGQGQHVDLKRCVW